MSNATSTVQKLGDALKHQQAGQLVQAERLYQEVLAEEPRHPDALHRLGVLTWQAGDPDTAAELLRQALRSRPDDATMHADLARILEAARRYDLAIDHGLRAVAIAPGNPELVTELARLRLAAGDAAGAEETLTPHVAAHPSDAAASRMLAQARVTLDDAAGAIEALRQSVQHDPHGAPAQRDLATLLARCGHADEARTHYRRTLELTPDDRDTAAELAATLLMLADADAAARIAEDILTKSPRHCGALGVQALLAHLRGDDAAARRQADPATMVRAKVSGRVPGFEDIAAFHRALVAHIESHPTLRHVESSGTARAVTDDLLVGQRGPAARLARIVRDGIEAYLAADPFPAGHPFAGLPGSGWRLSMRAHILGPGARPLVSGAAGLLRGIYVVRPGIENASLTVQPGGVAVPVPEPPAEATRAIPACAGTLAICPGFMTCRFGNPAGAKTAIFIEFDAAPEP